MFEFQNPKSQIVNRKSQIVNFYDSAPQITNR